MMTINKALGSYKGLSQDSRQLGSRLDLYDSQKGRSSAVSKKEDEQFRKVLMQKLKSAHK